jgi:hypothetical protein
MSTSSGEKNVDKNFHKQLTTKESGDFFSLLVLSRLKITLKVVGAFLINGFCNVFVV